MVGMVLDRILTVAAIAISRTVVVAVAMILLALAGWSVNRTVGLVSTAVVLIWWDSLRE